MWWIVAVAAMGGACLGLAVASWLAAGARADEAQERQREWQRRELEHGKNIEAARKLGYDTGWDACDLMHKRKRQAAALQGAQTRKNGGRRDS